MIFLSETGTKTIEAESDWQETIDIAEEECEERLKKNRDDFLDGLKEDSGERIVRLTYPNEIEANEDDKVFKCTCKEDIHWEKGDNQKHNFPSANISSEDTLSLDMIEEIPPNIFLDEMLAEKIKKETIKRIGPEWSTLSPDQIIVKINSLEIYDSELILSDYEINKIPVDEKIEEIEYENCKSFKTKKNDSVTIKLKQGKMIEFNTIIKSSSKVTADFKFGNKVASGEFGAEFSRHVEITNTRKFYFTKKIITTESYKYDIPPMKIVNVKFSQSQYLARRKFKGNVFLDGKVTIDFSGTFQARGIPASTFFEHIGEKNMSDVLPELKERTHFIEGFLNDIEVSKIKEFFRETECQ